MSSCFVLLRSDPRWPTDLNALPDCPEQLRVRGRWPELAGAVAIVGTRAADPEALDHATELAFRLGAAGRTIVSGGALGIDGAAHRGALRAGAPTLAVLPNGLSPTYPPGHDVLFEEIAAGGALVTEKPDGTRPHKGTFLARNRLIAALCEHVIVVQAPFQSGALSTAAHARKLKKTVWAVPAAPWDLRGRGFVELVRLGARICTSPQDVLSVPAQNRPLALLEGPFEEPEAARDRGGNLSNLEGLDTTSRSVLGALGRHSSHPDKLSEELGLTMPVLLATLLELELLGRIERSVDGQYRVARASESRAYPR